MGKSNAIQDRARRSARDAKYPTPNQQVAAIKEQIEVLRRSFTFRGKWTAPQYEREAKHLEAALLSVQQSFDWRRRLDRIASLIEAVDQRCMTAEGPVTNTRLEMTDDELRKIYRYASKGFVRVTITAKGRAALRRFKQRQ